MSVVAKDVKSLVTEIKSILAIILSIILSLGLIPAQSTSDPIKFKDSDAVKLSAAVISDTHIRDDSFRGYNFSKFFEDLENSGEKFDATVIAGDLVDSGFESEYAELFRCLESQTVGGKILMTMGNHDARYEFKRNKKIVMAKVDEYLGIDTAGKSYYSYDVNGYTFIMLCTEAQLFEKAYISDEQLQFLDSELARATKNGKPAFVVCHQPLKNTHGLPEVWETGDIGEQSDQVKNILTKYKNVFYLSGHLHDGVYERSIDQLAENVYSINLPTYSKDNDFGKYRDPGLGYYIEVYEDEVVFTARNFRDGTPTDINHTFNLAA